LQLIFQVHANPDDTVTMVLAPRNSSLLELTEIGPRTQNQQFTTTLRIKDGEPFIIGGFLRDEERVTLDRFPFLSELPLLGHLFKNREVQNVRSELIFVFTPHIIKSPKVMPTVRTEMQDMEIPLQQPLFGY